MACNTHRDRPHDPSPPCPTETYAPVSLPCASHAVDDDTCQLHSVYAALPCLIHTASGCNGHNASACITLQSTDSCAAYTADVGTSLYVFTDDVLSSGVKIKATHYNQLRDYISAELTRRATPWPVAPAAVLTAERTRITGAQIKLLRNGITAATNANDEPVMSWTIPSNLTDANLQASDRIYQTQIQNLRNQVRTLETGCVCQCNYCTCLCNYCTCVCNYACTCNCAYACTCDCNYCTCVCHYECTCNCNYS